MKEEKSFGTLLFENAKKEHDYHEFILESDSYLMMLKSFLSQEAQSGAFEAIIVYDSPGHLNPRLIFSDGNKFKYLGVLRSKLGTEESFCIGFGTDTIEYIVKNAKFIERMLDIDLTIQTNPGGNEFLEHLLNMKLSAQVHLTNPKFSAGTYVLKFSWDKSKSQQSERSVL